MIDDRYEPDREGSLYEIRVDGQVDERWSEWFNGLTWRRGQNETVFTAMVADQAALRGLLNRIWDLNLAVISLIRLAPEARRGQRPSQPGRNKRDG